MSLTRLDSWLHPFGSLNRGKCGMQIVTCGRGIEYSEEEEYGNIRWKARTIERYKQGYQDKFIT